MCKGTPFTAEKILPHAGLELGTRSVGQYLPIELQVLLYCVVEPNCSTFRTMTEIILGVSIFRFFRVYLSYPQNLEPS